MIVRVQCSCGELTYKLPEKLVELVERAEKARPGAKNEILTEIEVSLHSVTNAMVGTCLCIGPMGFGIVSIEVAKAMLPLTQASLLTMKTMEHITRQRKEMGREKK